MSLIQLDFTYEGCTIYVHYYSSLFNGRIHSNKSLHSCDSVSIILSIFHVYPCENYLSSKIYFMCFFLAYLLIELDLFFLQLVPFIFNMLPLLKPVYNLYYHGEFYICPNIQEIHIKIYMIQPGVLSKDITFPSPLVSTSSSVLHCSKHMNKIFQT